MAVVHLTYPKFRAFDSSNNPLSGGKVNVYTAGTSDRVDTYTDQGAGTANANPVILDANGEAEIWYNTSVKIVLTDSDDVQLWSMDNVQANIEPTVSGVYNLVQNGSFETDSDSDGSPDNWTLSADTNGTIAIDSSSGNHAHGNNALKFTSGGSGGGSATTTPYSEVLAGESVHVLFNLKSSAADNTCIVTLLWYQNDSGLASSTASTAIYSDSATNPTSWSTLSGTTVAPADAYFCKVKLSGVDASGTVASGRNCQFDDVRLYEGPVIFPNVANPITADDTELNTLDGLTSSTAELNILDGVTSTAAELNILDGVTSTASELNILDGVTASTADLNACTNFEEVLVANTTSGVEVKSGKTLDIVTVGALFIDSTSVTADAIELNTLTGSQQVTNVHDFASIPAHSESTTTTTLTGAVVGDFILVSIDAALPAGCVVDGRVSAADTVEIRVVNTTAGALDPASITYRCLLIAR